VSMEMTEARPGLAVPPPARVIENSRIWVERAGLRSRLKNEGSLLAVCVAVLVVSFAIPTLKSRHVWINVPCLLYTVTGVPCLFCGLTRSFIYTAHGNFSAAFNMHLLGPVLFFSVAICGVYLASSLASGYRLRWELTPRARKICFYSVLGVFIVAWIIKLIFMRGSW
jgi:Protein of unknown function (DUF2752)